MRGTLLALFVLFLFGCSQRDPADESHESSNVRQQILEGSAAEQLNIILITIDTLRADRLSSFGSQVQTPHLDELANEGVLFTNASTTVPFTFPAHSSIMTGTYPPFHGVRENVGFYLGEENITLAQRFGESGWETAGFVSAFVLDSRWGIARGFDHYFDDFDLGAFETANMGSVQRPGTETIESTLAWLDERAKTPEDRPFFLWMHLFDPHDPYTPPEPFRSQYPGRPYEAEVAYTDSLIGGFVDELQGRGLLEQSVLVLTADHGEGLGDHGETFHGYFVYDSTVHVPLIVRFPGQTFAGTRIDEAVSHVDIAPTLLDIVGQDIPDRLQGRTLLPTLADSYTDSGADRIAAAVYAESFYPLLHYSWAPLRALRSGPYKFIEAPSSELFDLATDPDEHNNTLRDNRKIASEMAKSLQALVDRVEEGAASSSVPDLDEQTLAQLQALGYVAGPSSAEMESYDPTVPRTDPKEKFHLHRTLMLAQAKIGGDEQEEATRLLEQALVEDPNLLDAHQLLGSLELENDQPEAAARYFESALSLDDQHRPSLFGLATAHRLLGNTDEALLGYKHLLDIAGQDSKATLAIADLEMEREGLEAAEGALQKAAQPGAPALIFNRLGEVQVLAGNTTEARSNFETAIENNPQLSQPHYNLAVLYEEAGDFDRSRVEYRTAIEKSPKHYKAQFNLARLLGHLGDKQQERTLLEQSIESKPDFAIGHFFLGKSLMEANELERAEEVTRSGLEILSESQLGWYVLADILNRRGRPAEAQQAVTKGKSISSDSAGTGG